MLQTLRDKSSGWIAKVILGLLLIPFAFFGLDQYLQQRVDTFAARVATPPAWWSGAPQWWPASMLWQTEEIAAADFRSRFEQARQQRRESEGERFDPRSFETSENKRQVLDAMIDEAVLRLASKRAALTVGDSAVRKTIEAIPAFQVDGKFDPQRYQLALASQSPVQSPREFEASVRQGLQETALPSALAASALVTRSETERLLRLLGQTRDVSFAVIPPPAVDAAAVSPAELEAWYKAHPRDYRAPETVQLEYVEVDGNALPVAAAEDEAALRRRYQQQLAKFVEPDQRLASHILIRTEADAPAATIKAAQAKATELAARARAPGADFAALARSASD
ncbi:MAG TPA: SurA N-terminal domain-containing protein, partial [Xanthomonadaceae bacterium]|nr:SurA N-terminal domain-containing protein [Xanthomonadaceae bacterium]